MDDNIVDGIWSQEHWWNCLGREYRVKGKKEGFIQSEAWGTSIFKNLIKNDEQQRILKVEGAKVFMLISTVSRNSSVFSCPKIFSSILSLSLKWDST